MRFKHLNIFIVALVAIGLVTIHAADKVLRSVSTSRAVESLVTLDTNGAVTIPSTLSVTGATTLGAVSATTVRATSGQTNDGYHAILTTNVTGTSWGIDFNGPTEINGTMAGDTTVTFINSPSGTDYTRVLTLTVVGDGNDIIFPTTAIITPANTHTQTVSVARWTVVIEHKNGTNYVTPSWVNEDRLTTAEEDILANAANITQLDSDKANTADVIVKDTFPTAVGFAPGDETTAITTGTNKFSFRMPYAMTLTSVYISVATAPTGAALTIDINEAGTSLFSTVPTIDATEFSTAGADTAAVISDSSIAADALITVDYDQVGSSVAGAGVKIWLIGTRIIL